MLRFGMRAIAFCIALLPLLSCKKSEPEAVSCRTKTAELKRFLNVTFDPAFPQKPPWPTGDVERDRRIYEVLGRTKAGVKPLAPSAPANLSSSVLKPGALETELLNCPPAVAQLKKGLKAPAGQQVGILVGIADAIAQCNCQVDLPMVRAMLYMMQRLDDNSNPQPTSPPTQ